MGVERDWRRIVRWLEGHAPRTAAKLRPPAGRETQATVAASFRAESWPEDLRAWYALQDGEASGEPWGGVLTQYVTLSLDGVLDEASVWAEVFANEPAKPPRIDPREDSARPAGDVAYGFPPEFVPIGSNGSGDTLFVDLRQGPLHGCVSEYLKDADPRGPIWASVSAMLADLADSLERGRACDHYNPRAHGGELLWKYRNTGDPPGEGE